MLAVRALVYNRGTRNAAESPDRALDVIRCTLWEAPTDLVFHGERKRALFGLAAE